MKIQCEGCNAVYDIKDDKIPEKGISTKCKKCGNSIRVEKNQDNSSKEAKTGILKQVGERAREQASNIGEITKDVVRRVDREQLHELVERTKKITSTQTGRLDKFLIFSFKFGKVVSGLFVFIFFLSFIGGIAYYFIAGGSSFKTPEFETVIAYYEDDNKSSSSLDFSDIDTRRKLEDKYGDEIKDIIRDYKLSNSSYDAIVGWIRVAPENLQDEFMDGIKDFLKDSKKWAKKKDKKDPDYSEVANSYKSMFFESLEEMKKQEGKTSELKMMILAAVGCSLILFIIFLLIPILIKIEENTRLSIEKTEGEI